MALQNLRALQWRGEDLGFGGGNTRENTVSQTVPASSRPLLQTYIVRGALVLPTSLGSPNLAALLPQCRAVINRSPVYFITVIATLAPLGSGATASVVHMPVPPLQTLFLPPNIQGDANTQVVANSTLPIAVAPGTTASVPVAGGQNAITFDLLLEG
jgi:hypothetical protein